MFGIHFFYIDIDLHFQAGSAYMGDETDEFNNRPCRNGFGKIDLVTADGDHFLTTKPGSRDKCHFIHEMHSCPSEKGIIVIGGVWKDSLKNPCFGIGNSFFKCHSEMIKQVMEYKCTVCLRIPFTRTIYSTTFSYLNKCNMPFINFNSIPHLRIWDNVHGAFYHSDQMTFGHIVLEEGAIVAEHQHIHEQWTHVLEGTLEFTLGEEKQIMTPGIGVYIPSNMKHQAKAITKCKLMDAFLPVREDFKTLAPWLPVQDQQG
jgi:quercetin dioxygenase-like cupin family protein